MISIMSRVAAVFHNPKDRAQTYRVNPLQIHTNAPDWVKADPLFQGLKADGSLEEIVNTAQKIKLENEPTAGVSPDGKKAPAKKG